MTDVPTLRRVSHTQRLSLLAGLLLPFGLLGCNRHPFPTYPVGYREFAYVTDGASNTVAVLDLVYLRQDRVLQVGKEPTGLAVNPVRNEVYAVNAGSDSVSVIDTESNQVTSTIGVHRAPFFIDVAPDGKRAYVANSGSNTVSVLDLEKHRELGVAATGEGPGLARVSPDNRTLVVSNRVAGSVSVYTITNSDEHPLQFREAFSGCPGATDIVISPDYAGDPKSGEKAFVACSGGHQVMALWLNASPDSWRGQVDASLQSDHLLTMLDVGQTPTSLVLKPGGGEVFSTNFDSDSISEISTWTNEVLGTYLIGQRPTRAVISQDNSRLWVTNYGADSVTLYNIDDGRLVTGIRTGAAPDPIAFSADEHLLLVANTATGDVAVLRMQGRTGPGLVTLLPAGKRPNDVVVKAFTVK